MANEDLVGPAPALPDGMDYAGLDRPWASMEALMEAFGSATSTSVRRGGGSKDAE